MEFAGIIVNIVIRQRKLEDWSSSKALIFYVPICAAPVCKCFGSSAIAKQMFN
jgi:hypothetical protein